MRQFLSIVLIALSILLIGQRAMAYCRKTTCELTPTPVGCTSTTGVDYCTNEGLPLYWSSPCIAFSVQKDGSVTSGISATELEQRVRTAFDAWMSVTCADGRHPNLYVATYPQASCGDVGYRTDGPNQNLWTFRDQDWEKNVGAAGVIALTTLSVNETTGEILDADVELNSTSHIFTTEDETADTDLLSIVQHESGHVLGIDHTPWGSSTMSGSSVQNSIDKRSLETDDVQAMCAAMPPGDLPATCDPEPLGGFSQACEGPPHIGCCSIAPQRVGTANVLSVGACLVGLLRLRRRRGC